MKEHDIIHENGRFCVYRNRGKNNVANAYTVYAQGLTHSVPDSSYAPTEDGKSLAIARCDYLAKQFPRGLPQHLFHRKEQLNRN